MSQGKTISTRAVSRENPPPFILVDETHEREYALAAGQVQIGRGGDNDIIIADEEMSRRHATLQVSADSLEIRDENSLNGTFVNERKIAEKTSLRNGNRVRMGETTFRVRATAEAPREAAGGGFRWVAGVVAASAIGLAILALVFLPNSPLKPASMPSPSTPTGLPRLRVSPTGVTSEAVRTALLAAVEIAVPIGTTKDAVFGSGSIVDTRGYILTNYHVVRDIKTGLPWNAEDAIYVYVNSSTDRPPDRVFRARISAVDSNLDLVLLKLTATQAGGELPADLDLTAVPIGDSDRVQIGDRIMLIGYPGIGGNTVTLTEGIVSGFVQNRQWIKTDAQINHGNSGGLAINVSGALIGVPTQAMTDTDLGGTIGLIRPILLAQALFAQAR
jgi:S1-C subfamily serine protease